MAVLTTLFTCLPLLSGGNWQEPSSELGGSVYTEATVPPPGLPATVRLLDDQGQCVAEATTDITGNYTLAVPPGTYFVQVLAGNHEAMGQLLRVQPGSWGHHLVLPGTLPQPDLTLITPMERVAGTVSTLPFTEGQPARAAHELDTPAPQAKPEPEK